MMIKIFDKRNYQGNIRYNVVIARSASYRSKNVDRRRRRRRRHRPIIIQSTLPKIMRVFIF